MESVIENLNEIINSKRLLEPSKTIDTVLIRFQENLPATLSDKQVDMYDRYLIKLLNANGGDISSRCAINIGNHLSEIYERGKLPKFFNLLQRLNEKPTQSVIYAIGKVIERVGAHSKSALPAIIDKLLGMRQSLHVAACYALKCIIDVSPESVTKNADKIFKFASSYINEIDEASQLLANQLIRAVVTYEVVNIRKIRKVLQQAMFVARSTFVVEIAASSAGATAQRILAPIDKINDKKLQQKTWKDTFDFLSDFKENFDSVFKYFLDLLEPAFVYNNAKALFEFALSVNPQSMAKVNEFFGKDVRSELFRTLVTHAAPNITYLKAASFDEDSTRETAGIGVSMLLSTNIEERNSACSFFVLLAKKYPAIALENLQAGAQFLSAPPSKGDNLALQYNNMAELCAIILSVIEDREAAVKKVEPYIKRYVEFQSKRVKNAAIAAPLLIICGCMPEFEFSNDGSAFIDHFNNLLKNDLHNEHKSNVVGLRYCETALFYLVTHDHHQAEAITRSCLPYLSRMTPAGRLFLLKLCSKFKIQSAFDIFYKLVNANCITRPYALHLMSPMYTPKDYFTPRKGIAPNIGSLLFVPDEIVFGQAIIETLPEVFKNLSLEDRKIKLEQLIDEKVKHPMYAILLQLYKTCPNDMPEDFHNHMLKELFVKHITVEESQILSECIALHVKQFLDSFKEVSQYLDRRNSYSLCFLVASISKHVTLSDSVITLFLYSMQVAIKDPNLYTYALHALCEIYETLSQQLAAMMVGDAQCQVILKCMYSMPTADPHSLMLIERCVERLVPILLPFLSSESTFELLFLVIQCFRNTPVPFASEFFHLVLRASLAFSPRLLSKFTLKFPPKNSSAELKLSVCGAMSDASHISPLSDENFDLIPSVLILLQRTKDQRASQFVVSLARSTSESRMSDWLSLSKTVLSSNKMPGFGSATVQPNTKVKACALDFTRSLLPALAKQKELKTECLDDMMTSTIRAVETHKIELHEIAYQTLSDVITNFSQRTTDNCPILELYESQFSIACKHAFPSSLDVAANFITTFLQFLFSSESNNSRSEIMHSVVSGLEKVGKKSFGYLDIASKVVEICSTRPNLVKEFGKFFELIGGNFKEWLIECVRIRTNKNCPWEQLSSFRAQFSHFYSRFLLSCVWLRSYSPQLIDTETLAAFLSLEATTASETWRVSAGVSASTALLENYKQDISKEMLIHLIHVVCDAVCRNTILLKPLTSSFVIAACKCNGAYDNALGLLNAVIREKCGALALSSVLMLKSHEVLKYAEQISSYIVQSLNANEFKCNEAICAATILMDLLDDEDMFNDVIAEFLLAQDTKFGLIVCRRGLTKFPGCAAASSVARLCKRAILDGGIDLAAFLLARSDPIALDVLSRGVLSSAVAKLEKLGPNSASNVIDFITFCINNIFYDNTFDCTAIVNAIFDTVCKWGPSKTYGLKVTAAFARLVTMINDNITVDDIDEDKMRMAMSILKKHDALNSKPKPEQISLKVFSTNVKRRNDNDGEWQDLDDSSDFE